MATTGPALYPGSTTFPGATTYPGQGNWPVLWALYSTDDVSVTTPTWIDASSKVRQFSVSRGRDTELADIDAGTATVVVDNRDRTFDPSLHSSIRPMNRWWLREQFAGATNDMFKGYAESIDNQWPAPGGATDAVAVISCVDEFKVLALGKLPTMSPPRDSYEDRIMFDTPHTYWRMNYDVQAAQWQPAVAGQGIYTTISGSISSTDSAIVGDYQEATGAVRLAAATYYRTDVQETNGAGDVSGLTEFAVEVWVRSNITNPTGGAPGGGAHVVTLPAATGTVPNLSITPAGLFQWRVTNTVPTTFSITSSAITADTWYHVVAMVGGGLVSLYVNGALAASTAWSGSLPAAGTTTGAMGLGEVASSNIMDFDEVAFYRNALSATTIAQHYQAGTQRGYRGQLSGARIAAVLDSVGSVAPRSVQTGSRSVQAVFMNGQDPLSEARRARSADAVDAMLFISRDGTLTFLADGHRSSSPYNTVQATFDDDGTDFPYLDLNVDYSEAFLANEWNVTRTGGALQTASDSTSITRYFKRTQSITDMPVTLDADAATVATAMLAKYKDPMLRVTSIVPQFADPATADNVFARDLGDRIRVFRTPPGGGARIDQTLFIQKITIDGSAGSPIWRVSWGVSPL